MLLKLKDDTIIETKEISSIEKMMQIDPIRFSIDITMKNGTVVSLGFSHRENIDCYISNVEDYYDKLIDALKPQELDL